MYTNSTIENLDSDECVTSTQQQSIWSSCTSTATSQNLRHSPKAVEGNSHDNESIACMLEESRYLQTSNWNENDVKRQQIVECDENWDDEEDASLVQKQELFEESRYLQTSNWNENDINRQQIVECDEDWDDEEDASLVQRPELLAASKDLDTATNGDSWNYDNNEYVQNCKVSAKRKVSVIFNANNGNNDDNGGSVFSDGYDEQLFGDANDREWLNGMSEMERETVLFQRGEARESLRNQWQIRHKLKTHKLENASSGKGRFEQRQAQLEQNCVENPRRNAMTELIDKRIRSIDKRSKVEDNNNSKNTKGNYWNDLTGYVSTLEQINQLRLARFKLERIVYWPMFEKTVLNCFVRVCIGNDPCMRPVYRIAEIVGFVERSPPYNLGTSITNVALRLKHGAQHHNFNMQVVSNQPFTVNEFDTWQRCCMQEGVDMPSLALIARKQKLVEAALDYVPTEAVIQQMIEKKNILRQRPINITVRKACLIKERDAAFKADDAVTVDALNAEIGELNDEIMCDEASSRISSCPLAFINERNRQLNINAVDTTVEKRQHSDPFTRRMTQPRLLSVTQDKCVNKIVQPKDAPLKTRTPIKSQLPTFTTSGADLYQLHDFDIDLDLTTTTMKH